MKTFLKILALLIAAVCIAVLCIWGGEIATLRSIHTVEGNEYLYTVEYKASYDLDDVIEKDIDENAELLDYVIGRVGKGLPIKIKSSQVAEKNAMLVTNHLLSSKYYTTEPNPAVGNPHSKSWWRYETASAYLLEHNGILTLEQAQECLSQVHWKDLVWENGTIEDTQYSNVYDQEKITLYLRNWNDYDTTHRFGL